MALFKKLRSPFWWYSVSHEGSRDRGSTRKTTKSAASIVEAAALAALIEGVEGFSRMQRGITLRAFSERFLQWVKETRNLSESSRRYYQYGWRLIARTELASMRVTSITRDSVDCARFTRAVIDRRTRKETDVILPCSPAYTNQALRTLKVMLGKAEEWKLLKQRPRIKMVAAEGRDQLIDAATEISLEAALNAPEKNGRLRRQRAQAWLFLVILQDTGMRPDEVYPMMIEDIHWARRRIWVPSGKTKRSRRFVGMSERMFSLLTVQCEGRTKEWVFPSKRSSCGHLTSIAKGFRSACTSKNIDRRIVPYSARHTYGTFTMTETKNAFMVSNAMGHADIKSMEPYQHPELGELNQAIDRRNSNRDRLNSEPSDRLGHTIGHTNQLIQ